MAALTRPSEATYAVHEKVTVKTSDREEHTFCGVMFPIECKDDLPIDHIVITSLSIRGKLGPITVWITKDPDCKVQADDDNDDDSDNNDDRENHESNHNCRKASRRKGRTRRATEALRSNHITVHPSQWTKIYSKRHYPSMHTLKELDLSDNPIVLKPGQVRGVYIHSTLPGDEAIVYDNHYGRVHAADTLEDVLLRILPAMAHVSEEPFGRVPIWGWGDPWRRDRKFVGSVNYGIVYRLWNPKEHAQFGDNFKEAATTLFACQRRWESPMSRLPDECIFYILNMCRWDWVNDTAEELKQSSQRRKEKAKRMQEEKNRDERKVAGRDGNNQVEDKPTICVGTDSDFSRLNAGENEENENANSNTYDDESYDAYDDETDDEAGELVNAAVLYSRNDGDNDEDERYGRGRSAWLRRFLIHNPHHSVSLFARFGGFMDIEVANDDDADIVIARDTDDDDNDSDYVGMHSEEDDDGNSSDSMNEE